MNGRITEHPHNTPEQVRGYIADALALVEELDTPGDLRAVAFVQACQLLAAKQIVMEQIAPMIPHMAIPRSR